MGGLTEDVLLARAFLSRIVEPGCVPVWALVRDVGPVEAMAAMRAKAVPDDVLSAISARLHTADPEADLEAAERYGIRLIAPEHDDWPHFAMAALEHTGLARLATYRAGLKARDASGEPIPPLALWVKGSADVTTLATRSVAIVGSRGATDYGLYVARELAHALAALDVPVVSGGAYGIDGAAHRGALAADGVTVIVSAGGLDRPYPSVNAELFARAVEHGLLVSESPPGAAPQRQRFLTRNRLIASLGTGTVVVEAASRSGARNTVTHCRKLGRPVMAVPGAVTSPMSAGCHDLIRFEPKPAVLVTSASDVLAVIGGPVEDAGPRGELETAPANDPQDSDRREADRRNAERRAMLDAVDPTARRVFDGLRPRRAAQVDEIAARSAVPVLDVLRALPVLELGGLVTARADGYVIRSPPRAREL